MITCSCLLHFKHWGSKISFIFSTGHVNVGKLDPFTASLIIQNGSLEDNGVYICNASHNNEYKQMRIDIAFFGKDYS